jgi:hypothetical protein
MPIAFRSRLVAREPLYGAWSVLSSPLSVRLLAAAGLDQYPADRPVPDGRVADGARHAGAQLGLART